MVVLVRGRVERERKKKKMSCVQPLSGSAETLICMQYAPRRRKMKAAVPSSRTFQPFALGACVGISINAGADIARIPLSLSLSPRPPRPQSHPTPAS